MDLECQIVLEDKDNGPGVLEDFAGRFLTSVLGREQKLTRISAVVSSEPCESVHIHFVLVGLKLCRSQRAGG
ncbi:hypothetical protein PAMP_005336 [Pampus punctatissimus]